MPAYPATEDFFRLRLGQMIDLRHPRAVLALVLRGRSWKRSKAQRFARKAREGVALPELDLFGYAVV